MMDDSELDFTDLCGKLLKRVRKKAHGGGESGEEGSQPSAQAKGRAKRRYLKNNVASKRQQNDQKTFETLTGSSSQASDTAVTQGTGAVTVGTQLNGTQPGDGQAEALGVKEKVVRRMQQFKRVSPQKLVLNGAEEPRSAASTTDRSSAVDTQDPTPDPDGDEALAVRLQLEAEERRGMVDLELGGLFFCQICQRDLTSMSPACRAQHVNRCLDLSEGSAPPKAAPPPVPNCPICGKGFKSQKSRGAHLKRCAADMGVAPAVLMEALQRQVTEVAGDGGVGQQAQVGTSKRKGSTDPQRPARKKARKKSPALDEDTLVAMALSRSMMEQEQVKEAEPQLSAPTLGLQRRLEGGVSKRRCKKKGFPPAPPPLLLIQDSQVTLRRLQDRIATLLLCTELPAPPTPGLPSSTLPIWTGAAPLWQRSALRDGGPTSILDFYTPELSPPIEPWVPPVKLKMVDQVSSSQAWSVPSTEPITVARNSPHPAERHLDPGDDARSSSSPSALPMGSQTLRDLMDLAEEGMTLTQCGGISERVCDNEAVKDFQLSGFVPETERDTESSAALFKLSADLASMVNNPQLSDVQLQVDCGDVFFAHSFMLYVRCPLLVQTVHDSGFGVREEGLPKAQRVLLGAVPGQAVLALLQYIYTGRCSLTPELVPSVQELAVRFVLAELEELCQQGAGGLENGPEQNEEEEDANCNEQNFQELLRSMWEDEENAEEDEEVVEMRGSGGFRVDGANSPVLDDGDLGEERVDEDELDEIYEFVATQKRVQSRRGAREEASEDNEGVEGANTCTEEEEEQEEGRKGADWLQERLHEKEVCEKQFVKAPHMQRSMGLNGSQAEESQPHEAPNAETSLDRSYNRLFSQSWGDYVEPSPAPSSLRSHSPLANAGGPEPPTLQNGSIDSKAQHRKVSQLLSSDSQETISNLSVTNPLEPCSMLPVTGCSPGSTEHSEKGNLVVSGSSAACDPQFDHSKSSAAVHCGTYAAIRDSLSESVASSSYRGCPTVPEVIVLSDSGDEVDLGPKNVDTEPNGVQNWLSPRVPENRFRERDNLGPEPRQVPETAAQPVSEGEASQSPVSSPHVESIADNSWMVPGTPVQPMKLTQSSSTQTHSSMCRTQLFPRSLSDKSRSSSSSSSIALPISVTSATRQHDGPFRHPDGFGRFTAHPVATAGEAGSCSFLSMTVNPEDNSKNGKLAVVKGGQTEDDIRVDRRSEEISHAPTVCPPQAELSRRTSGCTGIEWTGVSPAASSTPLASGQSAVRCSIFRSESECNSDPTQSGTAGRTGSVEECSGESPQGESLGSLHLSLTDTSSDIGVNRSGGSAPNFGSTRESEHLQSPVTESEDRSLPQQTACVMDEPPMPLDNSWAMGGPFSLGMDFGSGSSPPEASQGEARTGLISPPAPPVDPAARRTPSRLYASMLDSKIWDNWEEEEEGVDLPLSQRVRPIAPAQGAAQLKTPVASCRKSQPPLEPITPMQGYSDMDTPELKNQLNKFGVRPLPKRQMVLKLKEIYHYTHQLLSSDSEEEGHGPLQDPSAAHLKHHPKLATTSTSRPFEQPRGGVVKSWPKDTPIGQDRHEDGDHDESFSASQDSTASSTVASEDFERSNPELCPLSDGDSDGDEVTPSQAVSRDAVKLQAVRDLLQSDPELYGQILQYQPLVLPRLQARLKEAGIRLGAGKLLDFLDSQCITFTTANPDKSSSPRGWAKGRGRGKKIKGVVKISG